MADGNDKNIQDLKARLGLAKAAKKPSAVPKDDARQGAGSAAVKMPPPVEDEDEEEGDFTPLPGPLPEGEAPDEATRVMEPQARAFRPPTAVVEDVHVDESAAKSGRGALIIAFLVAAIVFFGIGYLTGKIFKERTIGNYKISEAKQALDYFEKHTLPDTGQSTLAAIEEHKQKIEAIGLKIAKARENDDLESIRPDLLEFLTHCAAYGGAQVEFDTSGLYREGFFAAELIPFIQAFVDRVAVLHIKTQAVAKEAALIANVQAMQEERAADPRTTVRRILITPSEQNGVPWNTGSFLAQVMQPEAEQPEVPEGVDPATVKPEWKVNVLEEGKDKGLRVETSDIVVVDLTSQIRPLEEAYQRSALSRAASSVEDLKMAADAINFQPLKQKLEEVAKKDPYFTF